MVSIGERLRRLRAVAGGVRANFVWDPDDPVSVPARLQQWAAARPHDPFLWFEGRRWTVGAFDGEVNRHARAYKALGLKRGDAVALVMDNRPAYLAHFYGLAKIGVIAALINPNLRAEALVHAIEAADPKAVVVGEAVSEQVLAVADRLGDLVSKHGWVDVEGDGRGPETLKRWNDQVRGLPPTPVADLSEIKMGDVVAYIYTSGTTGLPKPAIVKHHRLFRAGHIFAGGARLTDADGLYCCLPLYHGNGSIIAVPLAIACRMRLALERKFSATKFWKSVDASESTAFIYVGELCRYLANQPPAPDDGDHGIRSILGNGMRPDLWPVFQERFGVERIVEFYAATEGNAETANILNRPGSCGPLLPGKMVLAAYDTERGELLRNARGFVVRAKAGEPGLLLGKIKPKNEFVGYRNADATNSKILRDVFAKGDAWFDSGDLLKRDHLRHLYFVDRLGDTFRWKGENVSTQEVGETLVQIDGVQEATVYGVQIDGQEGRAGMAALVLEGSFDPKRFFAAAEAALPRYAVPRFVKVVEALEVTGTFKQRKATLRDEGWRADGVWIRDPRAETYQQIDDAVRASLASGDWPV